MRPRSRGWTRGAAGYPRHRRPIPALVAGRPEAAQDVYDSYLKANRIEEGIANYDAVLQLMLGTTLGGRWTPAMLADRFAMRREGYERRTDESRNLGHFMPESRAAGVQGGHAAAPPSRCGRRVGEGGRFSLHHRLRAGIRRRKSG